MFQCPHLIIFQRLYPINEDVNQLAYPVDKDNVFAVGYSLGSALSQFLGLIGDDPAERVDPEFSALIDCNLISWTDSTCGLDNLLSVGTVEIAVKNSMARVGSPFSRKQDCVTTFYNGINYPLDALAFTDDSVDLSDQLVWRLTLAGQS